MARAAFVAAAVIGGLEKMLRSGFGKVCASLLAGVATLPLSSTGGPVAAAAAETPNILFVIMDDVGVDQLPLYGFGGAVPPKMPNLELIAENGVTFTNAWGMPECSPSRAAFFTGRYPLRTGVVSAIVENHLPQTHVSSFEATLPRVLTQAGYTNALIGKYHLGGENDPSGACAPSTRGWQGFRGNNSAGPPSIDLTAGGTGANLICGYHQTPDAGACYTRSGGAISCGFINAGSADPGTTPARTCLQRGGIFTPRRACGVAAPDVADFRLDNGYYVWPRTVTNGVRPPLSTAACAREAQNRTYMTTAQSDDAVRWWENQAGPRMLTVSFNAMHTPYQKAPTTLVPDPGNPPIPCNQLLPPRALLNSILEGMDAEIGRMLADIGLGTLHDDGRTLASLELGDTLLVVIGDNGTQGGATRFTTGFDSSRAKATVYEGGARVPLVIAGGPVVEPGREVAALVNSVDLFHLFGAAAGIDVYEAVPPSRELDAKPMTRYLTQPDATPLRRTNFTQVAAGTFTPDPRESSYPCLLSNICNDTLINDEALCLDNGGVWYGPGGAQRATSCCQVAAMSEDPVSIIPPAQFAVRDGRYKLVRIEATDCSAPLPPGAAEKPFPWAEYDTKTVVEFYDLTPIPDTNPAGLDQPEGNFLKDCPEGADPESCLPQQLRGAYRRLAANLDATLASGEAASLCQAKGDGNLDQRVNQADIDGWRAFTGLGPSRYDINLDGRTNPADRDIIRANLGMDCLGLCRRADLDRSGRVDQRDITLAREEFTGGTCDDVLCRADMNGDGEVLGHDLWMIAEARDSCGAESAEVQKR
jgi:hypothetical protein